VTLHGLWFFLPPLGLSPISFIASHVPTCATYYLCMMRCEMKLVIDISYGTTHRASFQYIPRQVVWHDS
jgi:hypothetical protein